MKKQYFSVFAGLCMLSATAFAGPVIYDNGAPDNTQAGGFNSWTGVIEVADPFELDPGNTLVGDAHWWGGYFTTSTGGDDFTLRIYEDSMGSPGDVVAERDLGAVGKSATGRNFIDFSGQDTGVAEYAYWANFDPISLSASTTYWFSVSNGIPWVWETTRLTSESVLRFGEDDWQSIGGAVAYNLTTVPEPATILLTALGIAGTWYGRRGQIKRA